MTRNTNKSKPTEEDSGRRRSARLADLDKDKPKESPKIAKVEKSAEKVKKSHKKKPTKSSKNDIEEINNAVVVENKGDEEKTTDEKEIDLNSQDKIDGFVVINKEDVPSVDSEEVKEAIAAQNTGGSSSEPLVTPGEVPASTVDIPVTQNGNGISEINNIAEKSIKEVSLLKEDIKAAAEPQTVAEAAVPVAV